MVLCPGWFGCIYVIAAENVCVRAVIMLAHLYIIPAQEKHQVKEVPFMKFQLYTSVIILTRVAELTAWGYQSLLNRFLLLPGVAVPAEVWGVDVVLDYIVLLTSHISFNHMEQLISNTSVFSKHCSFIT